MVRGTRAQHPNFNPRSPCGERQTAPWACVRKDEFQSTLPLRGATDCSPAYLLGMEISIHAPLAGSDEEPHVVVQIALAFQSTLPLRGATRRRSPPRRSSRISIHAPLAGSDPKDAVSASVIGHFNPRSPCGERRRHGGDHGGHRNFNPRSPCGERPAPYSGALWKRAFQSTLPLRGATSCASHAPA